MTQREIYDEFNEFVQSLIDNKDKRLLMTHKPSEVRYVDKYFGDYLTEEELQERQFIGRFWAIKTSEDLPTALFIIVDNSTVLIVNKDRSGKIVEGAYSRASVSPVLPDCLRGYYYNDN
jgi:hypothetical protein